MAMTTTRRRTAGLIAFSYLTDLAVSAGIVLLGFWLFRVLILSSPPLDRQVTLDPVYLALDRFTPKHLLSSYLDTVQLATSSLLHKAPAANGFAQGMAQAIATMLQLIQALVLGMPLTLMKLYREASGIAGWPVLAGFAMALGTLAGWLVTRRLSLLRLMLAAIASPFVIATVFLMLQLIMLAVFSIAPWLPKLAPYLAACPILCTLYWVIFPRARYGAAHALLRVVAARLRRQRA